VSLPEHLAIIEALEERDTELAESAAPTTTLGLAAYVEAHGQDVLNRRRPFKSGRQIKKTTNSSRQETIRETTPMLNTATRPRRRTPSRN